MTIYSLGDNKPEIHPTAFVHPKAVLIGKVKIGAESSVWPLAVLRGDDESILIGERSSIQDGTVIHVTSETPTRVGNNCTIGHLAHLEGCQVEDGALVGSRAVVLHRAVIGKKALVAAGSVVLADTQVPPGALAKGTPVEIRKNVVDGNALLEGAAEYVRRARRYAEEMRRVD